MTEYTYPIATQRNERNLLVATILENTRYDEDGNKLPRNRIRLVCRKDVDSTGTIYSWFTEDGEDCQVSSRTLQGAKHACWQAWGAITSPNGGPWYLKASWIR